ncbi:acyltransferase family protein [Bacillus tianshenii]|uniref:acyltransferase family protein n=1 Tax=Sutcliffiella tianshenii TaxID=1463404 RepID=UPI001CD60E0C|nr:acyltransferase family protein [Bacillus tianshenii]MCA1320413.1 acyltransferase family protein [Bacillus tianshenii]
MKQQINEIYWIRAIACLSVVFIHSLTDTYSSYDLPDNTINMMHTAQLMFMFATPMFVLIFEVILGNAYSDKIPNKFFQKRFLYLFLPYIFIPVIYGLYDIYFSNITKSEAPKAILADILLASWHGYFIIIILQFVVIHAIFVKFFTKIPAWIMLAASFILNTAYLYVANFQFQWFPQIMQDNYFLVRIPFLGWIFYFTVAYYVGKNLKTVKANRKWGFPLAIAATSFSLYNVIAQFKAGTIVNVSSIRLDLLFYTVSLFFFFYYLFSFVKKVPKAVLFISKYSFSIYLLHYISFDLIKRILPEMNMALYGLTLFLAGVFGSILISSLINLLPMSRFVIGPIRSPRKQKKQNHEKKWKEQTA